MQNSETEMVEETDLDVGGVFICVTCRLVDFINVVPPADILIMPPGFAEGMMFDKHVSPCSPWVTVENGESKAVGMLELLFGGGVWEETLEDEACIHYQDEVKVRVFVMVAAVENWLVTRSRCTGNVCTYNTLVCVRSFLLECPSLVLILL